MTESGINNCKSLADKPYEPDFESDWIDGLLEQVRFANENLKGYEVQLLVRRFCGCWPDCQQKKLAKENGAEIKDG